MFLAASVAGWQAVTPVLIGRGDGPRRKRSAN
jgi:hypothetical protein